MFASALPLGVFFYAIFAPPQGLTQTQLFLWMTGFVVLCRPDDYDEFRADPRARQIIGRESLELAHAFGAPEVLIAGDAATDFLGTEATDWAGLKEVLAEEEIPHQLVQIPARP